MFSAPVYPAGERHSAPALCRAKTDDHPGTELYDAPGYPGAGAGCHPGLPFPGIHHFTRLAMRVFASTVRNTGNGASLHSHKNLWVQKDAQGNKATLVENRSARIQTNTGDLIIRSETLNNIRDVLTYEWKDISPNSTAFVNLPQYRTISAIRHASGNITLADVIYWDATLGGKWFGTANFNQSDLVNTARKEYRRTATSSAASIQAGRNAYLNTTHLTNNESLIKANQDLILTGKTFNHISGITGTRDTWSSYNTAYRPSNTASPAVPESQLTIAGKQNKTYTFQKTGEINSWKNPTISPAILSAGGNLVADFSVRIESKEPYVTNVQYSDVMARPDTMTAKNILLRAGSIVTTDVMKASGDITLQSDRGTKMALALMTAGKDISVLAGVSVESWQSELKGQNITLVSRGGDVTSHTSEWPNFFHSDGLRWLGSLEASRDLSLTAGGNILLRNTRFPVLSQNISLVANGDITFDKNDAMLWHGRPGTVLTYARKQELFNRMLPGEPLRASGDITLSGRRLSLYGAGLEAGGNISLSSAANTDLNMRSLSDLYSEFFPDSRIPELRSNLKAGSNLLISSAADIGVQGAHIVAGKTATLQAGKLLWLGAYGYGVTDSSNDNNRDELNVLTRLHGAKSLTLAANGGIQADGSTLTSDGNITLTSGGNMQFQSARGTVYRESGNSWTESVSQTGVTLNSGGALTVISGGSILFQASRLLAKGAMDVAAKGGWLYAQAMEESSHYERQTTKRKWWGKKTTVKQTKHTTTNRVTEFIAGGNLSLLSRDDSTYEASKIEAKKNATLTSTNGKVNFLAVKNTTFEHTVSTSKGFYIKQANKGYSEGKWVLPSVYAGRKLTVNAASGISADIKAKNGQALQGAITALAALPGTEWLKGLNSRSDVQWNTVKDAYDSWNYKSQSLNPAVAAVIAIAAAAATAGSSLAATVASSVTSTVGGGAVTTGAVTAGMSSLAAQAAVALVENQGNLSKTLSALGSSSSVKSLATSMVIGGALAGFDKVMNIDVPPDKARLPALVKNEGWGKIVQRVAGQSVISSGLNTAINGGSFKDNLTNALLANIGNQINAEGAGLIGDNGEVLGIPGKSLSHAVVAGISAEIGRGDGKGAAAGALAAELAAITLGEIFVEPATRNNQIQSAGRIIGAITGAAVTNSSGGANSGANAAESVLRYNFLMHDEPARMAKKLADCRGNNGCEIDVRKEMAQLSAQNENKFDGCREAGNAICIDDMLNGISSASGYDMLGRQIGFDISREYELMGQNAYKKFDTCGWESGAGCGLKLWANESLPDALFLGLGYGAGKLLKPVVSNYIYEVTALSRKGGTQKLIDAANKPINGQGLSAAARAWEKHAGRPGGTFEPLKGNVQQKNIAVEGFIRDVLNDKSVVRKSLSGGAVEYRLPNGKGIRFNSDGSFNTVLDPKV